MFNLQEPLERRLATLKGKKQVIDQNNSLSDTSVSYIKKSLSQAGILNKRGKSIKHVISHFDIS
jgi:hypothetical protein